MGEPWVVRKQPPCLVKPRFHGARASADRRRDLLLAQSGVVTKHEWRSEPSGKRQDRLAHEGGTVALVSELVGCGIARDDRVERVLRGPPASVSDLGSCRGIAGVHDDPVDPWPQSVSFWEGVSKSPEAQECLLNGIVDFRGVTEEERGCAVHGRVPLPEEFLELTRIGVGNHVSKTLRHRRRFVFPPEQARHSDTPGTAEARAGASRGTDDRSYLSWPASRRSATRIWGTRLRDVAQGQTSHDLGDRTRRGVLGTSLCRRNRRKRLGYLVYRAARRASTTGFSDKLWGKDGELRMESAEQIRGKYVVAVIAFHESSIYATDAAPGQRPERLVATDPRGRFHKVRHHAGNPKGVYEDDSSTYWRELTEALSPAGAILVLGHGKGKANASHRWLAYVEEHRRDVASKVVADVRVDIDHLADEQVLRFAQDYFFEGPPRDFGDARRGEPRDTGVSEGESSGPDT